LRSALYAIRVIKSKRVGWVRRVARVEEMRSAYNILIGNAQGQSPVGRLRCR